MGCELLESRHLMAAVHLQLGTGYGYDAQENYMGATSNGSFQIQRSANDATPLTVQFEVYADSGDNSATYGSTYGDYTFGNVTGGASTFSAVIPAYSSSASITVMPVDDALNEGNETIRIRLLSDSAYTLSTTQSTSGTVTIVDNDQPVAVTIEAYDSQAAEGSGGAGAGMFWVRRPTVASNSLTVYYTIGGNATNGSDYASLSGYVTIPAGHSSSSIYLSPFDDSAVEGSEQATLTLSSSSGYTLGSSSSATVTIADNDDQQPTVMIQASDSSATESSTGADGGLVYIYRPNPGPNSLTVYYNIGGSATLGSDYASLPGYVTIPANVNSAAIYLTPLDDSQVESTEQVTLTLTSSSGYVIGASSSATVTIADDDVQTTVAIQAYDPSATEGSDSGQFYISRSGASSTSLTVYYTIGGSAMNGLDYANLAGYVTIPASQSSTSIYLSPMDDSLVEGSEQVTLTLALSSSGGYSIGASSSATVTIADDDVQATVTIQAADAQASEDYLAGGSGMYYVYRSGASSSSLVVYYTVSGSATSGSDYHGLSNYVTIPSGQSSASIYLSPMDDSLVEGSEQVTLTLSSSGGYTIGSSSSATVTIADDDVQATVTIQVSDSSASEGGDSGLFYVHRSSASASSLTVYYSISGTATSGSDYASLSGYVTIPANQSSTSIYLSPLDDSQVEGNEQVTLTLSSSSGYTIGSSSSATVTIADDDAHPAVTIHAIDAQAVESSSSNDLITFRVSRPSATSQSLTVYYTTSGTATSGSDYAPLSGFVTIPAYASQATITVYPQDDAVQEADEMVTLSLSSSSGYTLGSPSSSTSTIMDNDLPATVTIETIDGDAAEGGSNPATLRVHRGVATGQSLTVYFNTSGSAANGVDYMPLYGSITIQPGYEYADLVIYPADDSSQESTEHVNVSLTSGAGYALGSMTSASATILDNDAAQQAVVNLSASYPTAYEGSSSLGYLTVSRSGPTDAALTVHYIVGGSAGSGDYQALTGQVIIPAGYVSANIEVWPINDALIEGTETVQITLRLPPGAAPSPYALGSTVTNTIAIQDDDFPTVNLTASDPSAAEEGTATGQFLVTRSGGLSQPLTVSYYVMGSATAGQDYLALPGQVTIPAGESSGVITITPLNDNLSEGTESVRLYLNSDSGYVVGQYQADVQILDNDPAKVTMVVEGSLELTEGSSSMTVIRVRREGATSAPLAVHFSLSGTAAQGTDYYIPGSPLEIPAGATEASVYVSLIDDSLHELTETIAVQLQAGSDYYLSGESSASFTLHDNEKPNVTINTTTPSVWEDGSTSGAITLHRDGLLTEPLTVLYTLRGTATRGVDFNQIPSTITFPSGASSVTVSITPIDDDDIEGNETVELTLSQGSDYHTYSSASATVTILEDDLPTVAISATDDQANERDSEPAAFTVTRTGGTLQSLTVYYSLGGTATGGADYASFSGFVVIPVGSSSAAITVVPTDDSAVEDSETVIVNLSTSTTYLLDEDTTATAQIVDNDSIVPHAGNDEYPTVQNGELLIDLVSGVLKNDSDPHGLALTASLVSTVDAAHGTLTFNSDGSFRFSPVTDFVGSATFTYQVTNGSATSAPATVTLLVRSGPEPEIDVLLGESPLVDGTGSIDFGSRAVGQPLTKSITIKNIGDATLTLDANSLSLPTGFSLASSLAASVAPGQSTTLELRFDAATSGAFGGEVSWGSNDENESPFSFTVSATAIAMSEIEIWDGATELSHPSAYVLVAGELGATLQRTLQIKNVGTDDLTVDFDSLVLPSGFSFVNPQVESLAPGQSVSITLVLDSSVVRATEGNLSLVNGDSDEGPFAIHLVGIVHAAAPVLEVRKQATIVARETGLIPFGTTQLGVATDQTLTLTNIGSAPLQLSEYVLTPAGFATVGWSGATLAAGTSTTLVLRFTGEEAGQYSDTVGIFSNTPGDHGYYEFQVSGTVLAPEVKLFGGTTEIASTGQLVHMGNTGLGIPLPYTFAVHNSGAGLLNLGETINLPVGFELVSGLSSTTVQPGATATFTVALAGNAIGTYSGDISFTTNDVDEPIFAFQVTGAVARPEIAVSQGTAALVAGESSVDFGGTPLSTPIARTITITNEGYSDLVLDPQVNLPSGYQLLSGLGNTTLASGQSTTFTVQLVAAQAGLHTGLVTISSNDADEALFTFTVTGAVALPEVKLTHGGTEIPAGMGDVDFGITHVGEARTKTLTLQNSGFAPLVLGQSIVVPSGFTVVSGFSATTLAPGETTTFTIRYNATTAGALRGELSFTSNSPETPEFRIQVAGQTAALVDLRLWNDTGASASDADTSDPTLTGEVAGLATGNLAEVQFDINGDGTVDHSLQVGAGTSFFFVPPGLEVGPHTVRARLRLTDLAGESTFSTWTSQAFDLEVDTNAAAAVIDVGLVRDNGSSATDKQTSDARVRGRVLNDGAREGVVVEIDWNDDDVADALARTDSQGRFFAELKELPIGEAIVRLRAVEPGYPTGLIAGDWTTFEFERLAVAPPIADQLALARDTGTASDLVTFDPTIVGHLTTDGVPQDLVAELDFNYDGVVDATAEVDSEGRFRHLPQGLRPGWISVHVRGYSRDLDLRGSWSSLGFSLIAHPGPTVTGLQLVNDTGTSSSDAQTTDPTIQGYLVGDDSMANLAVEYDVNGDSVPDGSLLTDELGRFTFRPTGLETGWRTISVRASQFVVTENQFVTGQWQTISFHLQARPTPSVSSLVLLNDNGSSSWDGQTTDPTVSGQLSSYDQAIEFVAVELDVNNDDEADMQVVSNEQGQFQARPPGLEPGTVTVRARSVIFDSLTGERVHGSWYSLTFTLLAGAGSDPPAIPGSDEAFDATGLAAGKVQESGDAAATAALAQFNSALGQGSPSGGQASVVIGAFTGMSAGAPIGVVQPGAGYGYESGAVPTAGGAASPFVLHAPAIPTATSGVHNTTLNLSGALGGIASHLSGPLASSWLVTVAGDANNGTFSIDVVITLNYSRHEEGSFSSGLLYAYESDLEGSYSFVFHASGEYRNVYGSIELSGTFSVAEDHEYEYSYAHTAIYDLTSSSSSYSGQLSVAADGTYDYHYGVSAGTFQSAWSGSQVTALWDVLEQSTHEVERTDVSEFSIDTPQSHQEGTSLDVQRVYYGARHQVAGTLAVLNGVSTLDVTHYSRRDTAGYEFANDDTGIYEFTYDVGASSGSFARGNSGRYNLSYFEEGTYDVTSSGLDLQITGFRTIITGDHQTYDIASGSSTRTIQGITGVNSGAYTFTSGVSHGYSETGSYHYSPTTLSLSGSFSYSAGGEESYAGHSSQSFSVGVANNSLTESHTHTLDSRFGFRLSDSGGFLRANADRAFQGSPSYDDSASYSFSINNVRQITQPSSSSHVEATVTGGGGNSFTYQGTYALTTVGGPSYTQAGTYTFGEKFSTDLQGTYNDWRTAAQNDSNGATTYRHGGTTSGSLSERYSLTYSETGGYNERQDYNGVVSSTTGTFRLADERWTSLSASGSRSTSAGVAQDEVRQTYTALASQTQAISATFQPGSISASFSKSNSTSALSDIYRKEVSKEGTVRFDNSIGGPLLIPIFFGERTTTLTANETLRHQVQETLSGTYTTTTLGTTTSASFSLSSSTSRTKDYTETGTYNDPGISGSFNAQGKVSAKDTEARSGTVQINPLMTYRSASFSESKSTSHSVTMGDNGTYKAAVGGGTRASEGLQQVELKKGESGTFTETALTLFSPANYRQRSANYNLEASTTSRQKETDSNRNSTDVVEGTTYKNKLTAKVESSLTVHYNENGVYQRTNVTPWVSTFSLSGSFGQTTWHQASFSATATAGLSGRHSGTYTERTTDEQKSFQKDWGNVVVNPGDGIRRQNGNFELNANGKSSVSNSTSYIHSKTAQNPFQHVSGTFTATAEASTTMTRQETGTYSRLDGALKTKNSSPQSTQKERIVNESKDTGVILGGLAGQSLSYTDQSSQSTTKHYSETGTYVLGPMAGFPNSSESNHNGSYQRSDTTTATATHTLSGSYKDIPSDGLTITGTTSFHETADRIKRYSEWGNFYRQDYQIGPNDYGVLGSLTASPHRREGNFFESESISGSTSDSVSGGYSDSMGVSTTYTETQWNGNSETENAVGRITFHERPGEFVYNSHNFRLSESSSATLSYTAGGSGTTAGNSYSGYGTGIWDFWNAGTGYYYTGNSYWGWGWGWGYHHHNSYYSPSGWHFNDFNAQGNSLHISSSFSEVTTETAKQTYSAIGTAIERPGYESVSLAFETMSDTWSSHTLTDTQTASYSYTYSPAIPIPGVLGIYLPSVGLLSGSAYGLKKMNSSLSSTHSLSYSESGVQIKVNDSTGVAPYHLHRRFADFDREESGTQTTTGSFSYTATINGSASASSFGYSYTDHGMGTASGTSDYSMDYTQKGFYVELSGGVTATANLGSFLPPSLLGAASGVSGLLSLSVPIDGVGTAVVSEQERNIDSTLHADGSASGSHTYGYSGPLGSFYNLDTTTRFNYETDSESNTWDKSKAYKSVVTGSAYHGIISGVQLLASISYGPATGYLLGMFIPDAAVVQIINGDYSVDEHTHRNSTFTDVGNTHSNFHDNEWDYWSEFSRDDWYKDIGFTLAGLDNGVVTVWYSGHHAWTDVGRARWGAPDPITGFTIWSPWVPYDLGWVSPSIGSHVSPYSQIYNYVSEAGHFVLDILGFIPGFGEIADGVNAVWYLAEGRYWDASLSAVSLIPEFGDIPAKATRYGVRGVATGTEMLVDSGVFITKSGISAAKLGKMAKYGEAGLNILDMGKAALEFGGVDFEGEPIRNSREHYVALPQPSTDQGCFVAGTPIILGEDEPENAALAGMGENAGEIAWTIGAVVLIGAGLRWPKRLRRRTEEDQPDEIEPAADPDTTLDDVLAEFEQISASDAAEDERTQDARWFDHERPLANAVEAAIADLSRSAAASDFTESTKVGEFEAAEFDSAATAVLERPRNANPLDTVLSEFVAGPAKPVPTHHKSGQQGNLQQRSAKRRQQPKSNSVSRLALRSTTLPREHSERAAGSWNWAWVSACLLLAAFCGWRAVDSISQGGSGTRFAATGSSSQAHPSASPRRTRPIEEMRVGDRVLAENPLEEDDTTFGVEVDPGTWSRLTLACAKNDGSMSLVELLRPDSWIEENLLVGSELPAATPASADSQTVVSREGVPGLGETGTPFLLEVAVPECGIDGLASVLAIDDCPPLKPGRGRVVTGTFQHWSSRVFDLTMEYDSQPLGTTGNHLFWSVDRENFVPADELLPGERLQSLTGTPRVVSVLPRPGPTQVYNLEVHLEHVYLVGSDGVLVHNSGARGRKCATAGATGKSAPAPKVKGPRGKDVRPGAPEDHHAIPWNNQTYKHFNNKLVKLARVDLFTLKKNLKSLLGHRARHSSDYHKAIRQRLNDAYDRLKKAGTLDKKSAQKALDNELNKIWRDIKSGKLAPYRERDVMPNGW